ncbi:MAG TPA: sn-glycerol-3-phosphate ABC transporter ATP-binding protein UgpC [bacterium]|nr:sn-glycerol-3-phosphate ABC transporter ATP-binding protein UgpC [bacterium]HNT65030.1 sn-glycerol-3-phosphate ABC transporter ATP-binding protein UgpC [bacterium]HOX84437.1 sn-glycerol-3-phosphate ABC transporter ATP-binding protein UgpC [bacterium]HPG45966.1 sn-glycerol-3-phosphate ABC transporter ATP-binding protein UgpC [bacterium]HPM97788.1 sn-glycerol-3-phosphate ABC transporter ATP-binding protein UgpC [bacterium]
MASVELKNVTKVYDNQVVAVKEASLEIKDREFAVLVGPSGCGKSTLLRMIAGLEEISEGEILIDGKTVNDVPPKNRDIAMVFQNYALYPHMTVFDNMAFGLKLRHLPKTEIKQRVMEAAEILHIKDYLDRKPKALSGGQRQRVAVGRAIVRKPKVFLFDEPLSNLDAKLRVQMRIEINRLYNRLNTTMIYVTHDQVEAMTMGTKIVVLKDGVIQQVDSPLNLYNNPVNQFVAGFMGSPAMNFICGEIQQNGDVQFISELLKFEIPEPVLNKLKDYNRKSILLGVRPENVLLANSVSGDIYSVPQKIAVDVVEPIGNEIFLYFRDSKQNYCMRMPPEHIYACGDTIEVVLNLSKIYFFDSETGYRLA